ncbi:hypothetical protein NST07_20435 [Paenibacillus sp. FSL L8-0340]|uniref:hypothetical protein n=1 Tax=Paenibacillus sp. FSL L8-0340 TaxID=2954685 RepID=UPI003157F260
MIFKNVQAEFNSDTRVNNDNWSAFREMNREQVFKIVFKRNFLNFNRILLLGAGNGNDIDINYLEDIFDEVVVADIDEEALDYLISKSKNPNKFTKVIIDLSGVESQMNSYDFNNKTSTQIETFVRKLKINMDFSDINGEFDCVINCNYTSQLVNPFILKTLEEYNIKPTSNLLLLLSELSSKIITILFNFIYSVLHAKGIFIHSTDLFEVSFNEKTDYKSPGFIEIMTALNGKIENIDLLLKGEVVAPLISKYALVGSYIPDSEFKFESLRFVPWKFSFKDYYVKYYICMVYAYKKGFVPNQKIISDL